MKAYHVDINGNITRRGDKKKKKLGNADYVVNEKGQVYTVTQEEEDIAPVKSTTAVNEGKQKDSYLQKGALSDGFSFKNLNKAKKATETDFKEDVTKGILGLGERIWDGLVTLAPTMARANYYQNGGGYNVEADKIFEDSIKKSEKDISAYVAKDLIKEEEIARKLITEPFQTKTGINVEESSVIGSKGDALVQSASDMLVRQGLNLVVPGAGLAITGVSSFGGEAENAFNNGAKYEEAVLSGLISAGAEVGTEKIAGIKFGGKTLTEGVTKSIAKKVPGKVLGTLTKWGFNTVGEGAEEVIAGKMTAIGQHLTYQNEKEIDELFSNEDAWESFVAGAILGGVFEGASVASSNLNGTDYVTEREKNEQKVIDTVYKEMVAEQETDGKKLTQSEKNKIYKSVENSVEKGYLDIETIEKTLGGDTYKAYKDTVDSEDAILKEYEELGNTSHPTLAQTTRYNELTEQVKGIKEGTKRTQLKEQLSNEVFSIAQKSRLAESYNEKTRKGQVFEADLAKYDTKQQEVVKKAIDSGILNNTNRTHEFVDMVAKISADKGVLFDFANNEKLKESGFAIGDKTINGFVKDGNVTLNIDSAKSLNSVVGHEITHVLEGTDLYGELQSVVTEFAKTKGEYDARYQELAKLYENVEGANVDAELVADLVGDYLFTDETFINNLSTEKPNIFKRIYNEIKYLCKVATAGSKEARELEKVKRTFEKAYKESANYSYDERLSLSSMGNTFFGNAEMTADEFEKAGYKNSEGYKNYVDQCLNNYKQTRTDFNEEDARKEIEVSIEGIVKVALAAKRAGYDIYDDSTKRDKKDSKNRLLFSSLEPNSDYFTSSDISTICDKRKNFAEIYDEIVRAEEAKGIPNEKRFFSNVDNYFYLHKVMAEKGLTQPCRQCYVESMRKNLSPMANAFIKLVNEADSNNKSNDQLYQQTGKTKGELKVNNAKIRERVRELLGEYNIELNVETLTTEDGLAQLKIQAPLIYEAFNSFYGQSKPKMPKSATPFRFGELTALLTDEHGKIKKSLVDKINSTGGFRLQSYSDFQIQNYTDVLQVIFEAGTMGLNGHAYTKVPAFLEATEGTNLKRNISIFMYKDGNEWKIDKNDSFPYELEEIYNIVNADKSGNTSIIAVSQNEDMSAWIMANDNIGYGIPFHKSGLKMGVVRDTIVRENGREIKGYAGTKDHTKQQTEVWAKTNQDHKALTKVKKGINIYEFWDFDNKDNLSKNELIEKNVKAYIDACEEAGYLPKFREYVMNNAKVLNNVVKYSNELGNAPQNLTVDDISFSYKGYQIPYGYYKFLGDFGMFKPNGEASPHEVLSLNNYDFDKAANFFADAETLRRNEILQQFANGEERQKYRESDLSAEELNEIVRQKRKDVAEGVIRFSLSEDSKGRDVNPAVQKRFANSKAVDENGNLKVLYHGTASGEFSIFDKSKGSVEGDFGSGFYFTDNENDVSEHYEGGGPDFENKVARRAEQIEAYEDIDYAEAEERARKELYKGSHKFEVYLNIEKPAIVGETILFDPDTYYSQYEMDDYESEEDYEGEVEQLVADDIDNIIWDIDRNMDINSTDGIAEVLWNALNEGGIDIESLKSQINELYLEDSYGNFVGNEVVRQIIERLGYDGIIDPTVSSKWNMDMEEGTTHYIVFKPNQIKAVTNENPTDNPDIHLSLSKRKGAAQHGNYNVYGKDIRLDAPTTEMETQIPVEETQMESENAPTTEEDTRQYFSVSEQEEEVAPPSEEDNESERIAGEDLTKKNADRIITIQSEIKGHQLTKNVTKEEFAKKIAQKESEYESLKRKDTKKALDLRNQITRLETRRDALLKSLDNKIERANKRIENIEKESRYEKRKTKQNQYRELFGKLMGDTSTWKDKKMGIYYQTNTLRRNLRDVVRDADGNRDIARADAIYDELQGSVNRNEAKKNREANAVKSVFREMKINNAESTYIQMLGELRHNPDTTMTQEIVDEFYKKNKGKIDAKKVDKAIDEARKLYDSLYDRVNAALSEHGFKEMGYRKGYFPHFTDPKQNWLAKLLNWKVNNDEIPTDIAGLTELFEPQRTWQTFDKHRTSDTTDYNFLKGLDNYVNGALDWIYHIEDIQKNRAFETEIRYRHSSEQVQKKIDEYRNNPMLSAEEVESLIQNVLREAKNPLNNFVTDLHTRTNILAGKKSSKDRNMESDFNRHAYSIMTNVTNRVTANQVVGSISSAMTNFIPITQSWGQVNPSSSLVGMRKTIQSYMSDDGMIAKSDFLTNRLAQNEALYKDAWDKIGDKVGGLMEIVDNFTSQTVWRSKYYENIKAGMTEAQAIKDADQFAENVIAGRSKGNQPTIFHAKNPVTKMLTAFQLEVSNQYGYMFKDMPQEIGKEAIGKLAKGYATMFVGAYAYNALYSSLTGRDAAFDPIGIIEDFIKDLGGDDDEEDKVANAIGGLASNVAEEIPFVGGLLGGGRIPISSALPYNASISDAYADIVDGDWKSVLDEMSKPLYYGVLPMGGGQIRKTVQGLAMFDDEHPVSGSYTKSGNLRFPVEDTIANRFQAALFGQYASSNAREYFDRGEAPLKEKQIQEYADLEMPIRDYWDYRKGLKKQEKLEDKFEYIADLDVSTEQKNIMINNVVDRKEKVDMSNYDDFANFEEFDFYSKNTEKYNFLQENGISYSEYKSDEKQKEKYDDIYSWYKNYPEKVTVSKAVTSNVIEYKRYTSDLNDIRADKDANGKTINGSAKAKKIDYINGLDLDYGQKIILYRSQFNSESDKTAYNADIVEYLNGRNDLSYDEIVTILKELDFKVYADGTVEW